MSTDPYKDILSDIPFTLYHDETVFSSYPGIPHTLELHRRMVQKTRAFFKYIRTCPDGISHQDVVDSSGMTAGELSLYWIQHQHARRVEKRRLS